MNSKIYFVPGWMKRVAFYGEYPGIDIWLKKFDYQLPKDERIVVVAHSMGCLYAVKQWSESVNVRLILINPLSPKRNILQWMIRWLRFAVFGGVLVDTAMSLKYLPGAFFGAIRYSQIDIIPALTRMDRSRVVVVRGSKDYFFCDTESFKIVSRCNVVTSEIEGLGHEWNEKFVPVIETFAREWISG